LKCFLAVEHGETKGNACAETEEDVSTKLSTWQQHPTYRCHSL